MTSARANGSCPGTTFYGKQEEAYGFVRASSRTPEPLRTLPLR